MRLKRHIGVLAIAVASVTITTWGQEAKASAGKPETIASSVLSTFRMIEGQFVAAADAMPEEQYSFAPSGGGFAGTRTFAQQVKHVACSNFGFFKQVRGETPPPVCWNGGPDPAKTKAEIMQYLRDSFAYANEVIAATDEKNAMDMVTGPYGGPRTRLGIAVLAVWHASDHYGQMVEYLRMSGIVPPASRGRLPANPR